MNRLRGVVLLVLGLAPLAARPAGAYPPQVRESSVRVDDRLVRVLCTTGPRRVLLLHGEASGADSWRPVLERLDGLVGACAYDRPRRDGHTAPRGWFELADELRRIHAALGFARGYVLVGHSLGGLYARLFAADRPTDVGALVLVDPTHENLPAEVRSWMPRPAWEEWMRRRRHPNADGVREVEVAERARASRLPDLPVTVITATERPDGDGWDARFLNQAARRAHASILHGVTLGRHVPAARSGHNVQVDDPTLVADEIFRVVRSSGGAGR